MHIRRCGRLRTHCRTGTTGNTSSTRCAARSAIRRPPQLGQTALPLQENGTSRLSPHRPQRNRANPPARNPQRKNPRNSSSMNRGRRVSALYTRVASLLQFQGDRELFDTARPALASSACQAGEGRPMPPDVAKRAPQPPELHRELRPGNPTRVRDATKGDPLQVSGYLAARPWIAESATSLRDTSPQATGVLIAATSASSTVRYRCTNCDAPEGRAQ